MGLQGFTDLDFTEKLVKLNRNTMSETPSPLPHTVTESPLEYGVVPKAPRTTSKKASDEIKRTDKMELQWSLLENSKAPVKNERYQFKLPLVPEELRAWEELYTRHKEGVYAWEHDPNDPRNT